MAAPVTTTLNANLIQKNREVKAPAYHDELSSNIREVFAIGLSDQEIKNAIHYCLAGKNYTVEFPASDIFKEEYIYDINNIIGMSPLFDVVQWIAIFYKGKTKYVRVWLCGDIRKFLPKDHKQHKS